MDFLNSDILCCPLDQLALRQDGRRLLCENGHSFDIARQGYVNLLGASDKRSRDPGDGKDMVAARRDFLDGGHYQPVANKLSELLTPLINANSVIVDAGCGEGYYLQQLLQQIESIGDVTPGIVGFDISKWAVQAATRRFAATWMVASNRNIPVAPHSVDCLLSLFGFPVFESFQQVLKDGGILLTVDVGPNHLIELREVIYPRVKHAASTAEQQAPVAGFSTEQVTTLQYKTAPLSQRQIHQLLTMTPHLFRASREGKKRAAQLDQFIVTVEVIFRVLRSQGSASLSQSVPIM